MTKKYIIKTPYERKTTTFIGVKSNGRYVLEGERGELLVRLPWECEEVFPFTVDVKFVGNEYGKTYSYLSDSEDIEVNDYVSTPTGMARVVAVDTRKTNATVKIVGKFNLTKF